MKDTTMMYLALIFCAVAQVISGNEAIELQNILQKTHACIFDFYLPETHDMNADQKALRTVWKEKTWHTLCDYYSPVLGLLAVLTFPNNACPPELTEAAAALAKEFPEIAQNGLLGVSPEEQTKFLESLRCHPLDIIRKHAAQMRKLYIALSYSCPVVQQLAHLPQKSKPEIDWASKVEEFKNNLPESTIFVGEFKGIDNAGIHKCNEIKHTGGEIDYLIIGSGPAASLIAHELCRQTKSKVVVLESGSWVLPQSIITESSSELMESYNMRTTEDGGICLRNGAVVGGGTTVNIDLAFSPLLPSIRNTLLRWESQGLIPSELIHGDNPFERVENAYTWVKEKVGTRSVADSEINANNRILKDAIETGTTYDLNAKMPTGTSGEVLKNSAADSFLLPAIRGMNNNHLSLIPDVKVKRVATLNTHQVRVEVEFQEPLDKPYIVKNPHNLSVKAGDKAIIHSKNVIICAGTLGSAEILLRSNIHNPNVGKGIVIHPSMGFFGRFERPIHSLEGLLASVYAPSKNLNDGFFFESMSADPAFIPFLHPGHGEQLLDSVRQFNHLGGFGVMLVDTPNVNNYVYIDHMTGKAVVRYEFSNSDKKRFKQGIKQALYMLFEQGAKEVFVPTREPLLLYEGSYTALTDPKQIEKAVHNLQFQENENALSSAHMQGSCKMGPNAITSVVSPRFKVWDVDHNTEIPNLYVCDSSIFPTSIGANPMQSIYTFAKLFVDDLVKVETRSFLQKVLVYFGYIK
jgi:choline dehydrogenase-like flavoprotein